VISVITFKAVRDVSKICFVIFLLWICGYLTFKQLCFFYFVLIAGLILSALAPAISSIYSVPSEWIGLKPAMILFQKFTHENSEKASFLDEDELERAIRNHKLAAEIISEILSSSPDLLNKYPKISEIFREINLEINTAMKLQNLKRQQREEREEKQRKESDDYRNNTLKEREKRNLSSGVPPINSYNCPKEFPIRATSNINEAGMRGIYYFPGERRGVEVYWCFANDKEAEKNKFRRPLRKPPKRLSS
jgi:hypothetical protein